jgi:hypothetical protein
VECYSRLVTTLHIDILICMRTTLILDDSLIRKAKKRAADAGLTLSELVNLALQNQLARPEAEAPPLEMITWGHGLATVEHAPRDFADALEADDAATLAHGR